jgi:hypothetical protein
LKISVEANQSRQIAGSNQLVVPFAQHKLMACESEDIVGRQQKSFNLNSGSYQSCRSDQP